MSKKKSAKTDLSSRSRRFDEDSWRDPLESVAINDDHWWCAVTMMIETQSYHARYVSLLNEAAEEGKRKAIYVLSYQKMLKNVRSLARQDPSKCPNLQRVCHYANKQFEANEESTWLLARVVKYMIFRAKVEVVSRIKKEQDLKRAIDEEYRIMQTVVDPTSMKNAPKKGDNTDRTTLGKANTRLRIREEEWRDIVYVDDAPLDGPNLYIILTGFHDPKLPSELMNIGVPLTCILKIRRPDEKLEYVPFYMTDEETFNDKKRSRFPEIYTVDKAVIYKFWTTFKEILDDSETVSSFSNVAFLTFKPPLLPDSQHFTSDDLEYEPFKKDIYDRVSFIVYDLYDLLRKHSNYLRSMLIQQYDLQETEEPETSVYRAILDALPTECVTVPTLLHVLLLQLEANLNDVSADRSYDEQNVSAKGESEEAGERTGEDDEISWVRENLRALNLRYNLRTDEKSIEEKPDEMPIELILHGDNLRMDTHHINLGSNIMRLLDLHDEDLTLADAVLKVFHDPRIANCWENQEQLTDIKTREYRCHINNIIRYFEPGIQVDQETIVHYLHLLAFDKIIQGDGLRQNERSIEMLAAFSSFDSLNKLPSEPSLNNHISESTRFTKSDTQIDYSKPITPFTNYLALFGLTDPREIILPGYLRKNVYGEQRGKLHTSREFLEYYDDVELLSRSVLLQACYECFQDFERFERRYFEPTDSMLLYFSNDYVIGDVTERLLVSSICTPVCLRDFVRYVLKEEMDWLSREDEKYRLESIARENKSTIEGLTILEDFRLRFGDEHFILPNSLKARDMKNVSPKRRDSLVSGTPRRKQRKEEREKKVPAAGGRERKGKALSEKASLRGRKREPSGIDTSFLPLRKILSLECAKEGEPHEFVGYDLGNLRVQIVEKRKIFHSIDGTLVRVSLERWLYEKPDLRIDVNLHGCTLRLTEKLKDPDAESNVFHLTTEVGIVLAFCKRPRTMDSPWGNHWKELDFDFYASWPSGLTIFPVTGDTPENPFYIRQTYISKGPEDVAGEAYRKFLRNGTVLKFLDDNRVIVLRPNGAVIECTAFEDSTPDEKNLTEDGGSKMKVKRSKEKETGRASKRRKGAGLSMKSQLALQSVEEDENEEMQRVTSAITDELMSQSDIRMGMRYAPARIKVTGYNVLDHDGRRYEVLRDLVVREYDRLPVRESSDYELGEIFTRRSDGTDMLFRSNGELVVNFTDGTRITTGYIIEDQPLVCDWTRAEFRRYFGSIKLYEYGDRSFYSITTNNSNNNYVDDDEDNELWQEELSNDDDRYRDEMMKILIADSFVSVLLTCRLEHKNYASVSYDQSAVSCSLSMPSDLRVSISRRGHYEVSAPGEVNLKIEPDGLIFTGEMCATCAGRSTTVYNFHERSGPIMPTIFTSTDLFGNVFEVKSDGTTSYRRGKSRKRSSAKFDFDKNAERLGDLAETSEDEDQKDEEEVEEKEDQEDEERGDRSYDGANDHEKYCGEFVALSTRQRPEVARRYRIFSMNRDLTAHEYVHRSVRIEEETSTVFNNEANVIHHPVSVRRSNLRRLITFVPVETGLRSKALLQSYLISDVKPTNCNRDSLLRSTYSIPYDWLFPFGRYGRGICCNDMYDMPLAKSTNGRRSPKTLRLRILHGFKEPGRNAILDSQSAMARYCQYVLQGIDECRKALHTSMSTSSEAQGYHKAWNDNIREFALGIRKNIDVASYLSTLQQQRRGREEGAKGRGSRPATESMLHKLAGTLVSRRSTEIHLEWYKRCMREKIILPYFENVMGSCFLLVMECIDRAIPIRLDEEEEEEEEEEEDEEVEEWSF
ncbi:hypothetical protein KPH14_003058 [Odynerus spinipes]|uniref:Sperm-associated antigen 17 n=1 Tax=Odynerus spinipes TaxID=1348599 RepID=A0AAD9VUD0_9HYME|nr:hypothetical protein KPH14_003058 [Odynerus spinipes]